MTAPSSSASAQPPRSIRYLARVERDVVTGFEQRLRERRPDLLATRGRRPSGLPDAQTFWVASQTGAGEQTIQWEPEDGNWRAVVMNADATRGERRHEHRRLLDSVLWIGLGYLPSESSSRPGPRSRSPPAPVAAGLAQSLARTQTT